MIQNRDKRLHTIRIDPAIFARNQACIESLMYHTVPEEAACILM